MKKITLCILLIAQNFFQEIKSSNVVSPAGPIAEFCYQNSKTIGVILAVYYIVMGAHFALDRVPEIYETDAMYNELYEKIKSGDATLADLITFIRVYTLIGSKADVLDRTTTTVHADGTKVEIHDKYLRRKGTGWAASFKYRILDNLEKLTTPILTLCGALWIINNAFKNGTIPGNK